jgi:hypothetical protein
MFYDFVEIGTSDFDTLIQRADDRTVGLSVDPIKLYLDRLPQPRHCSKLAAAISDHDGETVAYYIPPERIEAFGLPAWVRGCNSIGAPHASVAIMLRDLGLDAKDVLVEQPIPCLRLKTLLDNVRAIGVYLLKTDTEGHDTVILNDFFNVAERALWPHELVFETNILSDQETVHKLIARLITAGYDIVQSSTGGGATDTFLRLNLRRLKYKSAFTMELAGYHLGGYLEGYDPEQLPHENTPEAAAAYCIEHNASGVTFQNERFEVRNGAHLTRETGGAPVVSWVYL